MIVAVIEYFIQVLAYIVIRLTDFEVTTGVSIVDVFFWVVITSILLVIFGRLIRNNGNS